MRSMHGGAASLWCVLVVGAELARLNHELDVDLGEERAEDTMAGVALSEIGRRARPGDRKLFPRKNLP